MFKVAVIGSGPAAFYTAQHLLKSRSNVSIHMFEKLATPFGLVRFGIAADHQDAKKVANKFDELATHYQKEGRFQFVGGVEVVGSAEDAAGVANASLSQRRLPFSLLRKNYDVVIAAYGAESAKLMPLKQGKAVSAHDFVQWVNGHPDSIGHSNMFAHHLEAETAVVVGHGNVALDVARVLLDDIDSLRRTDVPDNVLQVLAESKVRHVRLVARRGPFQMAFTAKELREMTKLPNASYMPNELLSSEPYKSSDSLPWLDRSPKRLMQILHGSGDAKAIKSKSWALDWYLSPHQILQDESTKSIKSIQFQKTSPVSSVVPFGSKIELVPNEFVDMPCGLVISSLGYIGLPLPSCSEDLPFDARSGVIPNIQGRVIDPATKAPIEGLYASGWIKRGAVGVIAATMYDAVETADSILADLETAKPDASKQGFAGIQAHLGGGKPVSYDGWKVLDEYERKEGAKRGKLREKVVDLKSAMRIIHMGDK
ncbi:hypothetical protein HDU78_002602 [Chytriomyces hyalinus]|nr:hypothetical protein HDU78_002602 [Chytriomyces hyalinus]